MYKPEIHPSYSFSDSKSGKGYKDDSKLSQYFDISISGSDRIFYGNKIENKRVFESGKC